MWVSEPDQFKPIFVETLEEALAEPKAFDLEEVADQLVPLPELGPPPEGPETDLLALANLVNLANQQMG